MATADFAADTRRRAAEGNPSCAAEGWRVRLIFQIEPRLSNRPNGRHHKNDQNTQGMSAEKLFAEYG